MAEEKEKQKKKKIPDYTRMDITGVYYSQMKTWQMIALVLAVAVAFLSFKALKSKYVYLYSDQLEVVKLTPTSPKVNAFLIQASESMFRISYATFDRDVQLASYFMTEDTAKKFIQGMELLKSDFEDNQYIWTPETPKVATMKIGKNVGFTIDCDVIEVSVKTGKQDIKHIHAEGIVVKGTPNQYNLYPYRIKNLKIDISS